MEAQLREYRALRRRREQIENAKLKLRNTKDKLIDLFVPKLFRDMDKKEEEVLLLEEEAEVSRRAPPMYSESVEIEEVSEQEIEEEKSQESWRYFIVKWTIFTIIWLSMYIYFIQVGFGAVFFVISLLVGICLNTGTRKKRKGEVSAYSVFNKNCESIQGTLDAEQLQKQMLYGPASLQMF